MNRLDVEGFKQAEKIPLVLVLDNIRSHNNVGSVFRTADAFLVQAVYLCGITGRPPHRDIQKTALGATDSVEWQYFERTIDAIDELRMANYRIVALEQADESTPLQEFDWEEGERLALVMGNEVMGVDDAVMNMVDEVLEIPQQGTKHSLNIAVSSGIAIWELWRKYQNP